MGKSYNFVFNSSASSLTSAGHVYSCDWSRLNKNKKYEARFTFISQGFGNLGSTIPQIFMDLGCSSSQIVPTGGGSPYTSFYLGFPSPWQYNGGVYISSGIQDNPPIYLNSPPTSNQVLIQILNTAVGSTSKFTIFNLYTLILYLEEQD